MRRIDPCRLEEVPVFEANRFFARSIPTVLALSLACLVVTSCAPAPQYDVVIRNGTIFDGSGSEGTAGDVAINGDDNGGVFIVGYLFFEHNNIYGNVGNQLYNGNESESYPLRTTQCFWGTDDKDVISKQIIDGDDNPKLGTVTFEPFLSEPATFD